MSKDSGMRKLTNTQSRAADKLTPVYQTSKQLGESKPTLDVLVVKGLAWCELRDDEATGDPEIHYKFRSAVMERTEAIKLRCKEHPEQTRFVQASRNYVDVDRAGRRLPDSEITQEVSWVCPECDDIVLQRKEGD